jgi:negative regulator of flagellin synthesis FlgM
MIDRIGSNSPPWLAVSTPGSAAPRSVTAAEPATAVTGKAGTAPRFGALVRDMAASPPVDTARVAALRAAIASGDYAIDPEAIAARMLAFDGGGRG